MTQSSDVRHLADTLVARILEASPFTGTNLGLREYDSLVPDASRAAEDRFAEDVAAIDVQARTLVPASDEDVVTLGVIRSWCYTSQLDVANRHTEYAVTAMPIAGPPVLFATLARTAIVDAQAASDYISRLRGSATWLDQTTERLREGKARGRYPVGLLVDQAIGWAEATLATPVPPALAAPQPPEGWDGTSAWRAEIEDAATGIQAALGHWRDELAELRPNARGDAEVGIGAIPGGAEDYERDIAVHTTLTLDADEIHAIGLAEVDRLEQQLLDLGATLGLTSLDAVRAAMRASASVLDASASLEVAQNAIKRAKAIAHELMPAPLPEPCAVEPMPPTVAESGMAPHYTRPKLDGSRAGTYWFNTLRPTAGTGWDLEAVAFHEAVPGHHSQLARLQRLEGLPLLQQLSQTVHSEGWGLYAERLAGEFGLYSDARAEIGAAYMELHPAVRLVVDTGMHASGWSRTQAIAYITEHMALPETFLINEIDRYIVWPGQALAYLVGQREILRLRDEARTALGTRFDLPSFHAAILDSGSVPMPVLAAIVGRHITSHG